jgi:nucleoside-diphosphate-sugar epimerase
MNKAKVLVTGATSQIGRNLCRSLLGAGYFVIAVVRNKGDFNEFSGEPFQQLVVGDFINEVPWNRVVAGVDRIFYLASPSEQELKGWPQKKEDNYIKSFVELLAAAKRQKVNKFVLLSSIKVNGETSKNGPFTELSPVAPATRYGFLKLRMERELARELDEFIDWVVIRSPLVYGPEAKGNFMKLIGLINSGVPVPLQEVPINKSFIYIHNLIDVIRICSTHSSARNKIYLVSDGPIVKMDYLYSMISKFLGVRLRRIPRLMDQTLSALLRYFGPYKKINSNLCLESTKINLELGWVPLYSFEDGLKQTVKFFISNMRRKNES